MDDLVSDILFGSGTMVVGLWKIPDPIPRKTAIINSSTILTNSVFDFTVPSYFLLTLTNDHIVSVCLPVSINFYGKNRLFQLFSNCLSFQQA
jgi:hypothetical protein